MILAIIKIRKKCQEIDEFDMVATVKGAKEISGKKASRQRNYVTERVLMVNILRKGKK